jgi:putative PIG3 family NAD(P)H quinone oxidoreductase
MKAVVFDHPGDEEVLKLGEVAEPQAGPTDLLIKVRYAGVNRADLMQRQGLYPPPPGASTILGLECAGEVIAAGERTSGWRTGDRAMALLSGGGYAERVAVDYRSALHSPGALSEEEAAAFPEVFLTAFLNLFMLAEVKEGEAALIHGGGSGVGTAAIELLALAGARAIVTAGDRSKCERCIKLGASIAINYKEGPFAPKVKAATNGRGADVILDSIGAAYLMENIEALAPGGRMVLIGLMQGARAEIDLAAVLRRHLRLIGSTLRSRSPEEKGEIVETFLRRFGRELETGRLRPPIHTVIPLAQVSRAHGIMRQSEHFGKIVLRVE